MRTFRGKAAVLIGILYAAFVCWSIYGAIVPIETHSFRMVHVGFIFGLAFLTYPIRPGAGGGWMGPDLILAALGVATVVYPLTHLDQFLRSSTLPEPLDVFFGITAILMLLELSRRLVDKTFALVVLAFMLYCYFGRYLPGVFAHRGYPIDRIVGHMYMTLEGIFGTPIDVSSTFIILFTIYGAFLEFSGAGKFFIDFSFAAMGGKPSSAGRTVTLASFLLGGPSGSGVATTVTLGSVAYPMLVKAGYSRNAAGGLLAAGGIGAILSPPVLGAAAFRIAEFLKMSYLDVIVMAIVPTCLYYWSIFLMVELDARKFGASQVAFDQSHSLWQLTRLYGFHFLSLIAIIAIMMMGYTPIMAVFWATVIAFAVSFIRRDTALVPKKLILALRGGSMGGLSVAGTCAAAGIIVGVVTLTGLGLKFSSIIISYAGGNVFLTAVYTALIVWVIGLAVPVTASYIIAAVIAAPALTKLGVPDYAAHMFIFYYALLSEVSPPTALSPFAAAAITGGNPFKTTMMAWKYTLTAFLLPFIFTVLPEGKALLLHWEGIGVPSGVWTIISAFIGIGLLASGCSGWLLRKSTALERTITIAAALMFVLPYHIGSVGGAVLIGVVVLLQKYNWIKKPPPKEPKEVFRI